MCIYKLLHEWYSWTTKKHYSNPKRELKQIEKYFEEVDIESGLDIRKLINNKNKLRDILRIKI